MFLHCITFPVHNELLLPFSHISLHLHFSIFVARSYIFPSYELAYRVYDPCQAYYLIDRTLKFLDKKHLKFDQGLDVLVFSQGS